jgi:hypothetical protein
MLTRFQKRQIEASRLARNILADYGWDMEGALDRVLALCNGQRWLARMVEREMFRLTSKPARKAA